MGLVSEQVFGHKPTPRWSTVMEAGCLERLLKSAPCTLRREATPGWEGIHPTELVGITKAAGWGFDVHELACAIGNLSRQGRITTREDMVRARSKQRRRRQQLSCVWLQEQRFVG